MKHLKNFDNLEAQMTNSYKYPLASDTLDDSNIEDFVTWFRSRPQLTMGEVTKEYERQWAKILGRKYAVFCNSGSSANLLACYAPLCSNRLQNKRVIVPSTGWSTSINPAIQFGFKAIMCETDPDTFGLDLDHLEKLIKDNDRPSTVVLVHALGVPHKMDELMELKNKYKFIKY